MASKCIWLGVESRRHEHSGSKVTTHTGMKDIRTKATVITLASLGIGQLKQSLKKN